MGLTVAEKIMSAHTGREAKADEFVMADIDLFMGNDGSLPLVIQAAERIKNFQPLRARDCVLVLDHYCPSPSRAVAGLHQGIRDFAEEHGCRLYDCGEGICHRLLAEDGRVRPGRLMVGADSHTVTYGALNALALGVGSTDLAVAMHYGRLWFRVPRTISVRLEGSFRPGTTAKDLALFLVGDLGAQGADYQAIEFSGPSLSGLSMEARLTICNMMVEAGAKAAIMPFDRVTQAWLAAEGATSGYTPAEPDADAIYARKMTVNLDRIQPMIALPHQVDKVVPLTELDGLEIREAFLGTCTNGGLEDLVLAAEVIGDRKIHPEVRLTVAPASRSVLLRGLEQGALQTLIAAGAMINPPGCGACVGAHGGVPGDGVNVISTANRNFLGRMGNKEASIYLASPASLAAAVVYGRIRDPRPHVRPGRAGEAES